MGATVMLFFGSNLITFILHWDDFLADHKMCVTNHLIVIQPLLYHFYREGFLDLWWDMQNQLVNQFLWWRGGQRQLSEPGLKPTIYQSQVRVKHTAYQSRVLTTQPCHFSTVQGTCTITLSQAEFSAWGFLSAKTESGCYRIVRDLQAGYNKIAFKQTTTLVSWKSNIQLDCDW